MVEADRTWIATHRAPQEGIDAWAHPDPTAAPDDDLAGGIELQVMSEAGAWVRVRGENGWEGWVDGRLLRQVDPSRRTPDAKAYVLLGVAVLALLVLAVVVVIGGSS